MQNVQIIAKPDGHRVQCPKVEPTCPSCGEFRELQNTLRLLERRITELEEKVCLVES